jgi:hypothetical protein
MSSTGSTDPAGQAALNQPMPNQPIPAMPLENAVRALRRLAPGALLRSPKMPELGVLAATLCDDPAGDALLRLGDRHPDEVVKVVLAHQLRSLDRAMTGFFGPQGESALRPEGARLVRAARYSGDWRTGPPGTRTISLLDRLHAEPGLRSAALGWADVVGFRVLARELRRSCTPVVLTAEEIRLAARLAVSAVLPQVRRRGPVEPGVRVLPACPMAGPRGATLDVRAVVPRVAGFYVIVESAAPMEIERDGDELTLRSLWWNGLAQVTDDLGFEYLILAMEHGEGVASEPVVHWCHPRPAPGARVLYLASGAYRGEQLRFGAACEDRPARTSAEIPVKMELTASLA